MAQGVYLYGWDAENENWVKILVTDEGKLIIDPSEIFEDPPTEDEHGKAPASSWAFDHQADPDAHHAKFTPAEARAAIGNIFDENGKAVANINFNFHQFTYCKQINLRYGSPCTAWGYLRHECGDPKFVFISYVGGTIDNDVILLVHMTDHYAEVIHQDNLLSEYSDLKGTQYLSIPGPSFLGQQSFSDDIDYDVSSGKVTLNVDDCVLVAPVQLPEGVTVAGVIVYGNAGAEAETFELRRVKLLDATNSQMATQNINTEDITITNPVIDNANYAYFIVTSSLDIGDEIYGALIVYTL